MSDFERSTWFTRGWTLQELIAPKQVVFLTSAWEVFGTTRAASLWENPADLGDVVAEITGIPRPVFGDNDDFQLESLSVAERAKWIQKRETTKVEDMAYCLLGILGVYMSLVYREGSHAWFRLEHEVSRKHQVDLSLPKPNVLDGDTQTGTFNSGSDD